MKKLTPEDPEGRSPDLVAMNIAMLKALFPESVIEGPHGASINVDALKSLVGDATIAETEEKYGLNWHGKRQARQLALTPSSGTLRPCPEESLDWDTTQNLMIEGDNLEVLKLLQKSYAGRVTLIYIDPPYNTGKDFVYPDNYRDSIENYLRLTGQTAEGAKLSSNTESGGRFHTTWLNMILPRLRVAHSLLREDGVALISIDDGEVARLRDVMDELFGEENFLATFVWKRKAGGGDDSEHVAAEHEYVLAYAKDVARCELGSVLHESPSMTAKYNRQENGRRYYLERLDKTSLTYNASMDFDIECPDGTVIRPPQPSPNSPTTIWRWGKDTVRTRRDELIFERDRRTSEWRVYTRTWEPTDGVTPRSLLVEKEHGRNRDGTTELGELLGPKVFSNPKPLKLLRHLLSIAAKNEGSLVLDFFAGSGTAAHAVMEMNAQTNGQRRFIVVQLPEMLDENAQSDRPAIDLCDRLGKPRNIAELTKERLRRASKQVKEANPLFAGDLGFKVFKLASTGVREWHPNSDDLEASLVASVDHIKAGRTEADLLYEVLLKLGLDLCVPIETRTIAGKAAQSVGGGVLMACLAERITREDVEALGQGIVEWRKALAPAGDTTCIFRDAAFADDVAKTNLASILEQNGIKKVRSL